MPASCSRSGCSSSAPWWSGPPCRAARVWSRSRSARLRSATAGALALLSLAGSDAKLDPLTYATGSRSGALIGASLLAGALLAIIATVGWASGHPRFAALVAALGGAAGILTIALGRARERRVRAGSRGRHRRPHRCGGDLAGRARGLRVPRPVAPADGFRAPRRGAALLGRRARRHRPRRRDRSVLGLDADPGSDAVADAVFRGAGHQGRHRRARTGPRLPQSHRSADATAVRSSGSTAGFASRRSLGSSSSGSAPSSSTPRRPRPTPRSGSIRRRRPPGASRLPLPSSPGGLARTACSSSSRRPRRPGAAWRSGSCGLTDPRDRRRSIFDRARATGATSPMGSSWGPTVDGMPQWSSATPRRPRSGARGSPGRWMRRACPKGGGRRSSTRQCWWRCCCLQPRLSVSLHDGRRATPPRPPGSRPAGHARRRDARGGPRLVPPGRGWAGLMARPLDRASRALASDQPSGYLMCCRMFRWACSCASVEAGLLRTASAFAITVANV